MTRRLLPALVATLLGVASGAVVVQAPAQAAACAQGDGVTVVVDPHQLGGGVSTTCVPGSGSKASAAFTAAGVSMQRAARERGFVCRVNALPADAGCVQASPADAYWSLWVSTGNGSWSYAQIGVDGLDVPRGGWVAWSWQGQASRAQPGVTPAGAAAAQPSARPTSSAGGSRGPSSSEGRGGSGASGDGGASAGAPSSGRGTGSSKDAGRESRDGAGGDDDEDEKRARDDERARRTASSATPSASDATSAGSGDETRATSSDAGSGAPVGTLVAVAVVLALLGAGGVVAWRRRDDRS